MATGEELSERIAYTANLHQYLQLCQDDLASFLICLQWNPQHFFEQESAKVTCSYNADHKMPKEFLEKHEKNCKWIQLGYTAEELAKVPETSDFFYVKSKVMTVKLEKNSIKEILKKFHLSNEGGITDIGDREVPQTLEIEQRDFSVAERLALYEHVVQVAKELQRMQSLPEDSLLTTDFEALIKKAAKGRELGQPSSEAEKWAAMRDYKRRRQSYRAKNVHITKKTYTEIISEVIHNQVELLQELLKDSAEGEERTNRKHGVSHSSKKSVTDRHQYKSSRDTDRKSDSGKTSKKYESESGSKKNDFENLDSRRKDRDRPVQKRRFKESPEHKQGDKVSPDMKKGSSESRKGDNSSPKISAIIVKDLQETASKEKEESISTRKSSDVRKDSPCKGTSDLNTTDTTEHISSLKRPVSTDDENMNTEGMSHRHKQKHKKSKKHKRHKHKTENHEK